MTLEERFWMKVAKGEEDECWPWTGRTFIARYGIFSVRTGPRKQNKQKRLYAHRVAYELTKGEIPPGHVVRHMCHNRPCCNPAHLQTGTKAQNARDMVEAGRSLTGEDNPMAKLTWDIVKEMREMYADGVPYTQIAEKYGITARHASRVCRGKRWKKADT